MINFAMQVAAAFIGTFAAVWITLGIISYLDGRSARRWEARQGK